MKQVELKTINELYKKCGVDNSKSPSIRTELNTGWLNKNTSYSCHNVANTSLGDKNKEK